VRGSGSFGVVEPSHFGMRIADLGLQGKDEHRTFTLLNCLTRNVLHLCAAEFKGSVLHRFCEWSQAKIWAASERFL